MKFYGIDEYGAEADDRTDNSNSIQHAIDTCAEAGGGMVCVPPGIFRTGTVFLRNNVVLELLPGSELRAVESLEAFPAVEPSVQGNFNLFLRHALIVGDGLENIVIRGQGKSNVMGAAEAFRQTTRNVPDRYQNRPSAVRLVNCSNVRMESLQIRDSGFWTVHLMACRDVVVHGITLVSRSPNYNNDGFDIDSCEDVRISDCFIDSQDDAISIKGTTGRPCRRIMITNCILSSDCNAIRVGAENFHSFEDIHFSNIHIFRSGNGITFQNIDGYPMKRISFSNIHMKQVAIPVHIITNRKTYPVGVPEDAYPIPHGGTPCSIEDLVFEGIHGEEIGFYEGITPVNVSRSVTRRHPLVFSGHPSAPIRNLVLRNIRMRFLGGCTAEHAEHRPENINDHPNPGGDPYPVYGLLIRYAEKVSIENVRLETADTDERPAVGVEFVDDIEIHRLRAAGIDGEKLVGLHRVENFRFSESYGRGKSGAVLPIAPGTPSLFVKPEPFSEDTVRNT